MSTSLTKTVLFALAMALGANAAAQESWATSWHASPQPAWGPDFILPTGVPSHLERQTTRETVRLSTGGARLRLVFSNRYGHAPVAIGKIGIAQDGRSAGVTFAGQAAAVIRPGAQLVSDPVAFAVAPLSRLDVLTWFPGPVAVDSFHWGAQQTVAIAGGDRTGTPGFAADTRIPGRLFLNAVLVETPPAQARTVVVLGDSITDGNGSTADRDRRWPDALARRLAPHGIAVANAGISGARLLRDGMGVHALARLEQDVFGLPGATDLVVLLGTNDIGWPGSPFAPNEAPMSFDELADGYAQLVAAAHARGLRVTGATVPPFEHALEGTPYAGHYSAAKEALRQRVNAWIRGSAPFDAVVDFDALLRDPRHPRRLLPAYDSGDHLHPGDSGYAAMANAIDIRVFARRR
ncbi:SGNH/GDSL hydrolase family protein [Massilia sp. YIM B02763]|uniref:SGNH/GDSL hydrolase family protein n=1 Tax=Massilia sp. YIM B02763 TaxID=3050130 RepID=UPI0025B64F19|nr:SGNH/GDSL hydrolase family protein [Massilia sp. YIM B02763]MDN4053084.1 SGNH/GDSL hydrolase family protein [Massilia sp. YIM B02763]